MKVSIVIEHDDFGYYAFAPELPGCHSQGDTFEEARSNLAEAVQLYLSTMDEEDMGELSVREVWSSVMDVVHA